MGTQLKTRWLGRPLDDRLAYFADEFHVSHPEFIAVVTHIKKLKNQCKALKKGDGLLCLAPSGAGKTYLCKFLKRCWPDIPGPGGTVAPVMYFTVPPTPSVVTMGQALLGSIDDPLCERGTALIIQRRIKKLTEKGETSLILIDNVQDIPQTRGARGISNVGNWIRDLMDSPGRLVVLFGTPSAAEVVDPNDQVRRRAIGRMRIGYFSARNEASLARYRRFLREVDHLLPIAELAGLQDSKIAFPLFRASHGIMSYLINLLVEALISAVNDQREQITLSDLAVAFDAVFKDAGLPSGNPFHVDGPKRALDQPGEPFYQWHDRWNKALN